MIRKRWIIAIALLCLLSGTVGYVIAQSSLSTIYIMGGVYPGSVTYTVWIEGSTYYAKDANGQIDFYGTNASDVVQDVLNTMYLTIDYSGGGVDYAYMGRLLFQEGTYLFDTQLKLTHALNDGWAGGLIISGEGRYTTVLKAIGEHPVLNFTAASRDDRFEAITISGLEVTSDAAAQSVGNHALIFTNATFVNIFDCYFEANYDSAIYINDLETNFISNNGIFHSYGDGIDIVSVSDMHITDNNIAYNEGDGISLNGAMYTDIVGNTILYSNQSGIITYGCGKSQISANSIGANYWDGIRVTNCENMTIIGNTIYSNGLGGAGLGDGIALGDSNSSIVSGNRIFDDSATPLQEYGIIEEGTSDYNIIIGCNTGDGGTACGIKMAAAAAASHSRITASYNGTSWIATWGSG